MELCFILLKEENKLEELVKNLTDKNYKNIMVLNADSCGTNKINKDYHIFNSLRYMIDSFNDESRIILVLTETDGITGIKETIDNVTDKEDYLFFSIEANNVSGYIK